MQFTPEVIAFLPMFTKMMVLVLFAILAVIWGWGAEKTLTERE